MTLLVLLQEIFKNVEFENLADGNSMLNYRVDKELNFTLTVTVPSLKKLQKVQDTRMSKSQVKMGCVIVIINHSIAL